MRDARNILRRAASDRRQLGTSGLAKLPNPRIALNLCQAIVLPQGDTEREPHDALLADTVRSTRSKIRMTDIGPWPVTAPIARWVAPSFRIACMRLITFISALLGTGSNPAEPPG